LHAGDGDFSLLLALSFEVGTAGFSQGPGNRLQAAVTAQRWRHLVPQPPRLLEQWHGSTKVVTSHDQHDVA
jgi:hypothetical protein